VKKPKTIWSKVIKHKYLSLFILALIIIITVDFFQQGISYSFITNDVTQLQSLIMEYGSYASIIYVLLIFVEVIAAPIPSIILYSVGGVLFGGFWATVLTFIGNILGSTFAYYVSKRYFKEYILHKLEKGRRVKIESFIEKYGSRGIFFLRINPITSSDLVSYIAGLTNMKYIPFIVSTSLGLLPLIIIQSYIGSEFIQSHPLVALIFVIGTVAYIIIFLVLIYQSFSQKLDNKQ